MLAINSDYYKHLEVHLVDVENDADQDEDGVVTSQG